MKRLLYSMTAGGAGEWHWEDGGVPALGTVGEGPAVLRRLPMMTMASLCRTLPNSQFLIAGPVVLGS
jgi:hypothetical protein